MDMGNLEPLNQSHLTEDLLEAVEVIAEIHDVSDETVMEHLLTQLRKIAVAEDLKRDSSINQF